MLLDQYDQYTQNDYDDPYGSQYINARVKTQPVVEPVYRGWNDLQQLWNWLRIQELQRLQQASDSAPPSDSAEVGLQPVQCRTSTYGYNNFAFNTGYDAWGNPHRWIRQPVRLEWWMVIRARMGLRPWGRRILGAHRISGSGTEVTTPTSAPWAGNPYWGWCGTTTSPTAAAPSPRSRPPDLRSVHRLCRRGCVRQRTRCRFRKRHRCGTRHEAATATADRPANAARPSSPCPPTQPGITTMAGRVRTVPGEPAARPNPNRVQPQLRPFQQWMGQLHSATGPHRPPPRRQVTLPRRLRVRLPTSECTAPPVAVPVAAVDPTAP